MAVRRAFIGALGAGTSLAVAASILLLVVSSVVAFHGWPDALKAAGAGNPLALATGPASTSAPAAATAAAAQLPALALPRALATTRGAGRSARGVHSAPGRGPGSGTTTPPVPAGQAPAGGGSSVGGAQPTLGSQVSAATHQVAGSVAKTTDGAARVITPVAPIVAGPLAQIGAAGAATIDNAGRTVGGVIGKLGH
jgi:hypothetical protein